MSELKRFQAWLKASGLKVKECSCGGPAMGTDHAPDCATVRSEDDLWSSWREEETERLYQEEQLGKPFGEKCECCKGPNGGADCKSCVVARINGGL